MILADTNVLSELLRRVPNPDVLAWVTDHQADLAIATVTLAELIYGIERLPAGRRRETLAEGIERIVTTTASARLLPFDDAAARLYGTVRATRESKGLVAAPEDLMIAATALAGGHAVATRNVAHFEYAGLELINPWSPDGA